jgi:hypothetical protein
MAEQPNPWWKIILENWSQITVLLGVFGYIIKTLTDWKFKKNEISFSKIQEAKILEIKSFYKSYQSLEISLKNFINQTEFGEHKHEIFNAIREQIRGCFIDFEFNCMTVKLFIEKSEMKTIDEISKICETIRVDIERWHIYNDSTSQPENWDRLDDIRNVRLKQSLPNLIKRIESSLRKSYNVD